MTYKGGQKGVCVSYHMLSTHYYNQFLRAKAATAVARLSHRNSVRPSVRLSHEWISQKWCKLESPNLHCRL